MEGLQVFSVDALRDAIASFDYLEYALWVTSLELDDAEVVGSLDADGTEAIALGDGSRLDLAEVAQATAALDGKYFVLVGSDDVESDVMDEDGDVLLIEPIVLERWRRP